MGPTHILDATAFAMPFSCNRISKLIALFTLMFFFTQSVILPPPAHAFSIGDEKEMGERLLTIVRREFPLLDDPDISQYISGLGREIVDTIGPKFFTYRLFVINAKEFNAFAAPSGLIFMHSGLIEAMESEGELYSVLAHECGHVNSRHIADRIAKNSKMSMGAAALIIAGLALGTGPIGEALVTGTLAAGESLNLHFSRKDEEEADRLAYSWMMKNNRDPLAMQDMLQKMLRVSKYRGGNLPPYLLTHPEPERRLGYVQDLLFMDSAKKYAPHNEFAFQRFKTRVLSQTKDLYSLRNRYNKELAANPESGMANFGMAQVFLANAEYDKAIASMRRARQAYPDQAILLTDEAIIHLQAGHLEESRTLLQEAHTKNPDDYWTRFNLALAFDRSGESGRALSMLESLLDGLPEYAKLHYHIGQIKAKTGLVGEGWSHMGMYYWLSGNEEKALSFLRQSVEKLPAGRDRDQANEIISKINKQKEKDNKEKQEDQQPRR